MELTNLTIRPITGRGELGLFNRLPYVLNEELADDLAQGRRRPEWMWAITRHSCWMFSTSTTPCPIPDA